MYRLIFVDDESRVLEAIRGMMPWQEMNIQVIGWCDNAISALELMVNEAADILVTDIKMPVMNGLELISRAREMYPEIECLVLSGYEEFELARAAIEKGVRGYLLKPCTKEDLEHSIRSCVEAIERSREGAQRSFEDRQRRTEQLYDELMSLEIDNSGLDVERVRGVANRYGDLSLLRDAALMIVFTSEQAFQELQPFARELTVMLSSEDLVRCTVKILQRIDACEIDDPVVARMVNYVYRHYNVTSLTLQSVAEREIHLTPRYIGRRFLKEMNMKFSDFLLKVRMDKAIQILRESDNLNADEIAGEVGLGNNVQYFYRLFRQYTGMTFKEYREMLAKS